MRAGELRHRISIEQPTKSDGTGQRTVTWTTHADRVPAKIEAVGGAEGLRGNQVSATVTDVVTMRYMPGITPQMRVIHGDRTLNIQRVIDRDGRRRALELQCAEVA